MRKRWKNSPRRSFSDKSTLALAVGNLLHRAATNTRFKLNIDNNYALAKKAHYANAK